MLTTTIGAYPKPDSVAIETWFGARTRRPIEGYDAALAEMGAEAERLRDLRDRFHRAITEQLPEVYLNGDPRQRIPGNLNLSFAHVDAEELMTECEGLSMSSGSACTSASIEPSYVLRALGVAEELAGGALRIGFGRYTTEAEVDHAVEQIVRTVGKLRDKAKASLKAPRAARPGKLARQ